MLLSAKAYAENIALAESRKWPTIGASLAGNHSGSLSGDTFSGGQSITTGTSYNHMRHLTTTDLALNVEVKSAVTYMQTVDDVWQELRSVEDLRVGQEASFCAQASPETRNQTGRGELVNRSAGSAPRVRASPGGATTTTSANARLEYAVRRVWQPGMLRRPGRP